MKTTKATKADDVQRAWHVIDAANQPVGRMASRVAQLLRGKHKPLFDYHTDCGDFVIIINADKAVWTGNKKDELVYWHTGYPGGIRSISRGDHMEKDAPKMIHRVVWGMMPKGPLGREMVKKLKVYTGAEHPHEAQNPQPYSLDKKSKS